MSHDTQNTHRKVVLLVLYVLVKDIWLSSCIDIIANVAFIQKPVIRL